ncbi:MAG: hypothetical protein ACKOBW_09935 [Planctomycetota bacterium]
MKTLQLSPIVMNRAVAAAFLCCALLGVVGCGRPVATNQAELESGASPGADGTGDNQRNLASDAAQGTSFVSESKGAPRALPPASATPESVVRLFLQAARSGDESTATQLLTRKARQETEKEGLALEPPGTPTMKFSIADAEIPSDDPQAAYVGSTWTEMESQQRESFAVTWILRRQSDGWRIAGMATQTSPTEQPLWLNFEDPEHVQRIKREIGGEPQRTVADDPLTARGPSESARPGVRR